MSKHTPILQCGACGHKNEPERVYCHNCGEKLDRSLLPTPKELEVESDAQKRRRVKKMMTVGSGASIKREIKTFFQVIIFAALIAAMFLYWQKPADVPPTKMNTLPDRNAADVWRALMENKAALSTEMTEEEVNAFLKNALKAAESSIPGVKFERAFLTFREGTVTVTAERSAWGFPMFSSTTYAPRVTDGVLKFEPVGVNFGKLGVDPRVPYSPNLGLGGLKTAMAKELANLDRLAAVEPHEEIRMVEGKPERRGWIKLVTKPQ
jgi:hypothetical protein